MSRSSAGRCAPVAKARVTPRGSVARDETRGEAPRPSCAPGVQHTSRSAAENDPDYQAVLAEWHAGEWWTKDMHQKEAQPKQEPHLKLVVSEDRRWTWNEVTEQWVRTRGTKNRGGRQVQEKRAVMRDSPETSRILAALFQSGGNIPAADLSRITDIFGTPAVEDMLSRARASKRARR